MRYDLIDQFGNVVAQGLGDCVLWAVVFNLRMVDIPRAKRPDFPYSIYIFDVSDNEILALHGQDAHTYLMSVLDCVNRFGGKVT